MFLIKNKYEKYKLHIVVDTLINLFFLLDETPRKWFENLPKVLLSAYIKRFFVNKFVFKIKKKNTSHHKVFFAPRSREW